MILKVLCLLLLLSVAQAEQNAYTLQVDGLSCPFCSYGIEKQLSAIVGVDNIAVDISQGLITVTMQQDMVLDNKQAQQAVTNAGFSLRHFSQKKISGTDGN